MRSAKAEFTLRVRESVELFGKYELSQSLVEKVKALSDEAQAFEVLVPLVGTFSAGKSSLINALLKEDVLPTDLRPETTIATEIRCGNKSTFQLFDEQGKSTELDLENIRTVDTGRWLFAHFCTAEPPPQGLEDIVLVDMPGLDSGIKTHNKAILNYIHRGTFFVLAIDVEDGTLKHSTLSFLRELCLYKLNFGIVINKADKKPPAEVESVVQQVRTVAAEAAGGSVTVVAASAAEGRVEHLTEMLAELDPAALFANLFYPQLRDTLEKAQHELNLRLGSTQVDPQELDKIAARFEQERRELTDKLNRQAEQVKQDLGDSQVSQVLDQAKTALRTNSAELAQAASTSNDAFAHAVNETLRPILVSATDDALRGCLEATYSAIAPDLERSDAVLAKLVGGGVRLSENWGDVRNHVGKGVHALDGALQGLLKNTRINATYKSVTTILGVGTAVVAPWLELIIIFLPEILGLLGKLLRDPEAERSEVRRRIEFEAIPRIIAKLRPSVETSLAEARAEAQQRLQAIVEAEETRLNETLEQAKQQCIEKQASRTALAAEIQTAMEALGRILAALPA